MIEQFSPTGLLENAFYLYLQFVNYWLLLIMEGLIVLWEMMDRLVLETLVHLHVIVAMS